MRVRWKRSGVERSWHYGTLVEDQGDVVRIRFDRTGGIYNVLRTAHIEKHVQGPRGGWKWVPFT